MCYLLFLEKTLITSFFTRNYLSFDNCNHLLADCAKATGRLDQLLEFENTAYRNIISYSEWTLSPKPTVCFCIVTYRMYKTAPVLFLYVAYTTLGLTVRKISLILFRLQRQA